MAHYAEVVDGKVVRVLVADSQEWCEETLGGVWVQTSYNTRGGVHYDPETGEPSEDQSKALRCNFAGIGFTYDETLDCFQPPKPDDGQAYIWDESVGEWSAVGEETE